MNGGKSCKWITTTTVTEKIDIKMNRLFLDRYYYKDSTYNTKQSLYDSFTVMEDEEEKIFIHRQPQSFVL